MVLCLIPNNLHAASFRGTKPSASFVVERLAGCGRQAHVDTLVVTGNNGQSRNKERPLKVARPLTRIRAREVKKSIEGL
eukprot:6460569-Amphidinium_carterae.1